MANQRTIFDDQPTLVPCDPHVASQDERRLTGQNHMILLRLRQGPASNVELADLSLKYTSRISDLRAAGYRITCLRGAINGLNTYLLEQ